MPQKIRFHQPLLADAFDWIGYYNVSTTFCCWHSEKAQIVEQETECAMNRERERAREGERVRKSNQNRLQNILRRAVDIHCDGSIEIIIFFSLRYCC